MAKHQAGLPVLYSNLSALHFIHGSDYMSMLLSPFTPLFPSATMFTHPFLISVSPFLLCNWVHQYQLCRFHISVQFIHSAMSDSLRPHGQQHARLPVHHKLPEIAQTHVPPVGDAIQPSHPPPFPSPSAFNLSQHQGLFQWAVSSHQVAKSIAVQLQHQSFQWIFRTDFFFWGGDNISFFFLILFYF